MTWHIVLTAEPESSVNASMYIDNAIIPITWISLSPLLKPPRLDRLDYQRLKEIWCYQPFFDCSFFLPLPNGYDMDWCHYFLRYIFPFAKFNMHGTFPERLRPVCFFWEGLRQHTFFEKSVVISQLKRQPFQNSRKAPNKFTKSNHSLLSLNEQVIFITIR